MGKKRMRIRELLGIMKDKAGLLSGAPIRVAVLRATAHSPPSAPSERHVAAVLLSGDSSRSAASPVIAALMRRLRRTGSSVVALKCLVVVHHILRRGPFILQDQLSVFPSAGGHNHLNLSHFRDPSSPATWHLSAWVRWYARFLETLLSTSRVLGFFLCSSNSHPLRLRDRVSSLFTTDLIKQLDSLILLIEDLCRAPPPQGADIVNEIIALFLNDYISAVNEILLRLSELALRLDSLTFGDSVEVVCALKRLQDSRERLSALCKVEKPSIQMMWTLVQELKDKIGMMNTQGGKFLTWPTRETGSESARFERRLADSVNFQSGRFCINTAPAFWALDKSI